MMKPCIFCTKYKNNQDIVCKTESFFIHADRYPVNFGHVEIIPTRHIKSIFQLNNNEWDDLYQVILNVKTYLKEFNFKAYYTKIIQEGKDKNAAMFCKDALRHPVIYKEFNIGINEGRNAGRSVDHLHIHIIPRWKGDVDDPTGGVRCVISEKRNYKKPL